MKNWKCVGIAIALFVPVAQAFALSPLAKEFSQGTTWNEAGLAKIFGQATADVKTSDVETYKFLDVYYSQVRPEMSYAGGQTYPEGYTEPILELEPFSSACTVLALTALKPDGSRLINKISMSIAMSSNGLRRANPT